METQYVTADKEIMKVLADYGIRWCAGEPPTGYTGDGAYDYIHRFPRIRVSSGYGDVLSITCTRDTRQMIQKQVFLAELLNTLIPKYPASVSSLRRR